jgi:hypothetical protein
MLLSFCLVTRNAEQQIGRALQSISGLGAEVVVADTGSTDHTAERAAALGARTIVVAWEDDFAAAQNQALAQATGDWIFWLNPDEELLSPDRGRIAVLLSRPEVLAYAVRIHQLLKPDQGATETLQPRLFRHHPELRYAGRLHPHFTVQLEELARRVNMHIYPSDLVVRRHAYLSVLTPDKLRWATRLLELELADRPGQLHYLIEYGRNLLRLNDPRGHIILAEAADLVLSSSEAVTAPNATVASLLEYLLTVSPERTRSRLAPAQARELALRWFPNSPPLLWAMAQRAFQAGSFQEASEGLERLVAMGRSGAFDRSAAFDPTIIAEPAILNLAACYARLADFDRAEACFSQLFGNPTYQAQARQGYELVQQWRRQHR